jgi:hypothetical protein
MATVLVWSGPLVEVVADAEWLGMWRIRTRDGRLSDMVNLARAKDAAKLVARSENPSLHDVAKFSWKKECGERAQGAPRTVLKPLAGPALPEAA